MSIRYRASGGTLSAFLMILSACLSLQSPVATASQYSPQGLYDAEHFRLPNGMLVILKQRSVTHNVAIRLAINVGKRDFPCGRQELPHFLEHLLFTGTSRHSESELEALIDQWGGTWNATTYPEKTVYEIDIYSRTALSALDLLYEIMTDSLITQENVELSLEIIHREMGGKPSALRQWLYQRGIGRSPYTNAFLEMFPGSNVVCPTLQTAEGITRDDIVSTHADYYVPNTMTLVVVGEFSRGALVRKIERTFGTLERKPTPKNRHAVPEHAGAKKSVYTGAFSPLVGTESQAAVLFRTDGYLSSNRYVFSILASHLNNRLYETLRIDRGLSYSPDSEEWRDDRYGAFYLYADVNIGDEDEALEIMKKELAALRTETFHPETLEKATQEILLSWVQGFESNADIADYYVDSAHELTTHGTFINEEDMIEKVTAHDIKEVTSVFLAEKRLFFVSESPTLTFTQVYVLIGMAFVTSGVLIWRAVRRARRRSRSMS